MKKVILGVVYLLLASVIAQANDVLPQGIWVVTQITIDKNTDGKTEKNVYDKGSKVQSYIPCPQKWEVKDSKTIVLYYEDREEETARYTIEGNQLTVHLAVVPYAYLYEINNEKLTLRITHNYVNNLPTGYSERIKEDWTIVLQQK